MGPASKNIRLGALWPALSILVRRVIMLGIMRETTWCARVSEVLWDLVIRRFYCPYWAAGAGPSGLGL